VVCLIDVLIRDKFLRDDDMALRLQLPVKKLRATLQFLSNEHIVREESVDDLHEGGSQATRFFYIDYNRAVHSIRLRLNIMRQKLEKAELQARSSSFYLCPGYKLKRCNGRYTEEEAQRVLDMSTGLFLCQECSRAFENDPSAPPLSEYTLQLVDNEKDLKLAMDHLRRFQVQLSAKNIGNMQLRPSLFDLLQKVRGGKSANVTNIKPITSNLPSENFYLGIGSKRLAGTGRTAGIKAIKMQKKGLAESSAEARARLVGEGNGGNPSGNGANNNDNADLMFLKSAHGHEIQFTVEKGGGARAQVLARKQSGVRRRKLMDTAASRVGVALPIPIRVEEALKRKAEREAALRVEEEKKKKKQKVRSATVAPTVPEFLLDNIGRGVGTPATAVVGKNGSAINKNVINNSDNGDDKSNPSGENGHNTTPELVLDDEIEEMRKVPEENRVAAFQAQYKLEMDRQIQLLSHHSDIMASTISVSSPDAASEADLQWEDGF